MTKGVRQTGFGLKKKGEQYHTEAEQISLMATTAVCPGVTQDR